jgi:thiol-disulfide isomerase/thioredoxin
MDRLPAVRIAAGLVAPLTAALLAAACEQSGEGPVARRVVAVRAKARRADQLAGFCDVAGGGRRLRLPRLDHPRRWPPGRTRWVNVWATWCKPCLAEMPTLLAWRDRLARAGLAFELVFVSADESAKILADHRERHPRLPASSRLADPDLLGPWMTTLGLDKGAGLPIHVFAGPKGRVRCVRAAAVGDGSYAVVERLLRQKR